MGLDTKVYLKYQAYGKLHMHVVQKLTDTTAPQRPTITSVQRIIHNTAEDLKLNNNKTVTVTPEIATIPTGEFLESALSTYYEALYSQYLQEAAYVYIKSIDPSFFAKKPTKRQILLRLQQKLDHVIKDLLFVY